MPERTLLSTWRERVIALRNIPLLLAIVWRSGPAVVSGGLAGRIISAGLPIAMLAVSKRILDGVQSKFAGHGLPPAFWALVATEFALASCGALLGRAIGY